MFALVVGACGDTVGDPRTDAPTTGDAEPAEGTDGEQADGGGAGAEDAGAGDGVEEGVTETPDLPESFAELDGDWSTETGNKTVSLKFEEGTFVDGVPVATGSAVITGDGEEATGTFEATGSPPFTIILDVALPQWDCPPGPGTYDWFISETNEFLQLSSLPGGCFDMNNWFAQDPFYPISLP